MVHPEMQNEKCKAVEKNFKLKSGRGEILTRSLEVDVVVNSSQCFFSSKMEIIHD